MDNMSNKIIYQLKKSVDESTWNVLKENNAMIAGGALVSLAKDTKINDLDIYVRSKADCYLIITQLASNWSCVAKTNRSCVLRQKHNEISLNIIYFDVFNNLKEVFSAFDYECCKIGYDFKSNVVETGENCWRDLTTNTLTYTGNSRFPIGALMRMQKYIKKGYTIDVESILKLVRDLAPMTSLSPDKIVDQLSGMYGLKINTKNLKIFDDVITAFSTAIIEEKRGNFVQPEWDIVFKDVFKFYKIGTAYGVTMIGDTVIERGGSPDAEAIPLQFPITLYKYVNCDGSSIHYPAFKYNVGEVVTDTRGLYCDFKNKLSSGYGGSNRAMVELVVYGSSDVKDIDANAIRIYRAFVKSITAIKSDKNDLTDTP